MAVATPSVPATTVPVVNQTGQYVQVSLSGFTITVVAVNGVTVGSTNASYALPPGASIALTYTVAGTWAWTATIATSYPPGYAGNNPGAEGPGYDPNQAMPYTRHPVASFTNLGCGVAN